MPRIPFRLVALATIVTTATLHSGCGPDHGVAPPEPTVNDMDDFEDGDTSGWATWTRSYASAESIGAGFTLAVAGSPYSNGGSLGLRVRRPARMNWDVLETRTTDWTGYVQFACDIRMEGADSAAPELRIVLSSASARRGASLHPDPGLAFTTSGEIRESRSGRLLGEYAAGEWCHVEIRYQTGMDAYSLRVTGPGVSQIIRGRDILFDPTMEAVGYVQVLCGPGGECEFALDNVTTRTIAFDGDTRSFRRADYDYLGGTDFFLFDPEGPPLAPEDRVTDLTVWLDDRQWSNNEEQGALPAYLTMSGDPSLPEPKAERGTGDFTPLQPNTAWRLVKERYPGRPILELLPGHQLNGRMLSAMAVSFRTTGGLVVGGRLGTTPDTLILKMIRPATEMGGTYPYDLRQGLWAATARLTVRNTYSLGYDLEPEWLLIKIVDKTVPLGMPGREGIGQHTFLEILGLDNLTEIGNLTIAGPDGRVDRARLDVEAHTLIFCDLEPFAPRSPGWNACNGPRPVLLPEELYVPRIYYCSDQTNGYLEMESRFEIVVSMRVPSFP